MCVCNQSAYADDCTDAVDLLLILNIISLAIIFLSLLDVRFEIHKVFQVRGSKSFKNK